MTSRLILMDVPADMADPLRRFLEQLVSIELAEKGKFSLVIQESSDVFISSEVDLSLLIEILQLPQIMSQRIQELEKKIETRIGNLEAIQSEETQGKNDKDPELSLEAFAIKMKALGAVFADIKTATESIQEYTRQGQGLLFRKKESN